MEVYNGLLQDYGGNTGILFKLSVSNASLGRYRPETRLGGYQLRDIDADNHYFMAGGSAAGGSGEEALVTHQSGRVVQKIREKCRNDAVQ
jgi:hypothetical protein